MRIDDAGRYTEVLRYVCFGLLVHVLCPIETRWAAGTDAIGAQGLNGFFFQIFVCDQVVEVAGCEIGDCAAGRELRFRACRSW